MTASHVGVPAFDTQLWLLISASCKCKLWTVVMMAQGFEFLLLRWKTWIEYPLAPVSRPLGRCSHLRIRLSCGNSCFYVSHCLSFKWTDNKKFLDLTTGTHPYSPALTTARPLSPASLVHQSTAFLCGRHKMAAPTIVPQEKLPASGSQGLTTRGQLDSGSALCRLVAGGVDIRPPHRSWALPWMPWAFTQQVDPRIKTAPEPQNN